MRIRYLLLIVVAIAVVLVIAALFKSHNDFEIHIPSEILAVPDSVQIEEGVDLDDARVIYSIYIEELSQEIEEYVTRIERFENLESNHYFDGPGLMLATDSRPPESRTIEFHGEGRAFYFQKKENGWVIVQRMEWIS